MLREVVTISGSRSLHPHQIYCYSNIIDSLKHMFQRQGFFELCESTRNASLGGCLLGDVYDGNIWKDFLVYDGVNFLSVACAYAFM